MRFVSAGSLPPGWGGARSGGVASYHAELLRELLDLSTVPRAEVAGIFCGSFGKSPAHPAIVNAGLPPREEERLLRDLCAGSDAIILHHVSHRLAAFHERSAADTPAIAVIHSLNGVLFDDARRREEALRRVRSAAVAVVPSLHMLKEGIAEAVFDETARVVHPPLNPCFCGDIERDERRRIVAFVGTLDDNKGVAALVEAMGMLPQWQAVVVGQGPLGNEMAARANALGLSGRMHFTGELSDCRDVRDVLDRSSILCVPSRKESFGSVYIEALARGTAVVGYAPSIAEIGEILEMACGFGCTRTPSDIAAKIEAAHVAGFDRVALAARTRERFSAVRCAALFQDML